VIQANDRTLTPARRGQSRSLPAAWGRVGGDGASPAGSRPSGYVVAGGDGGGSASPRARVATPGRSVAWVAMGGTCRIAAKRQRTSPRCPRRDARGRSGRPVGAAWAAMAITYRIVVPSPVLASRRWGRRSIMVVGARRDLQSPKWPELGSPGATA